MSSIIGHGRYAKETYPFGSRGNGGGAPAVMVSPVDSIVLASASRLVDLDATTFVDGTFIYVRSVGDIFILKRPSAETVDNITTVNALGGGQWLRIGDPNPSFLFQDEWHVNVATGNDENPGSELSPLLTWSEWERRLGTGPIRVLQQNTLLKIAGGNVNEGRVPTVNVIIPDAFTLTIEADPVVSRSGTLTAATTTDPATNVQQSVTDGTGPGWVVGSRIAIDTGTDPAITFIGKQVSANEGRIGDPIVPTVASTQGDYYEPVGDETYEVQTLRTLDDGFRIAVSSGGTVVVKNLEIVGGHTAPSPRFRVFYVACKFTNDMGEINFVAGLGFNNYISCCFGTVGQSTSFAVTTPFLYGGVLLGTVTILQSALQLPALNSGTAHVYVQGLINWVNSFVSGTSNIRTFGIFDSATFGMIVVAGQLSGLGPLYGAGNTIAGGVVSRGAKYTYNSAAKPTIAGAPNQDWLFGSTFYTYASIPFVTADNGVAVDNGAIGLNAGERIQLASVVLTNGVGVLSTGIFVQTGTKIQPIPRGNNGGAAMGTPTETARTNGVPGTGSVTITSILPADGTTVASDVRTVDLVLTD